MDIKTFFAFNGRVRRMTFWINMLVIAVVNFVIGQIFVEVRFDWIQGEHYHISNKPVYYLLSIIILVRMLSVVARRWQDQDKSGWLAAFFLLPTLLSLAPNFTFYSTFGIIVLLTSSVLLLISLGFLGFVPGDDSANEYGPVPAPGQLV